MSCRACNFNKPNLKNLFQVSLDDDGGKNTLAGKLEAVTGCSINPKDSSPKTICFQCKLLLEMAYEFQKMSKQNELLHSQQKQPDSGTSDPEMFEDEEFLDDQQEKEVVSSPPIPIKELKTKVNNFCEHCDKTFHTKSALDIHTKLKHKKNKRESNDSSSQSPPKKNIKIEVPVTDTKIVEDISKPFCTICEKHFHTEKALVLHVKLKHKNH